MTIRLGWSGSGRGRSLIMAWTGVWATEEDVVWAGVASGAPQGSVVDGTGAVGGVSVGCRLCKLTLAWTSSMCMATDLGQGLETALVSGRFVAVRLRESGVDGTGAVGRYVAVRLLGSGVDGTGAVGRYVAVRLRHMSPKEWSLWTIWLPFAPDKGEMGNRLRRMSAKEMSEGLDPFIPWLTEGGGDLRHMSRVGA